ncbi:hypothetical protein PVAND_005686 [Polypedilum vanderplanki]|uniref:Uncharacterized protein n=1 Tax=Polypedilum vanderplanki TaxID=319348 RepID=A0A9J6C192_POLVA|nr:hypothetical protein PVAND_005686 [Polypedilum vanderplanki]
MNLMFRKNFRESGSGASSSKNIKLNKINRSGGKRSRDMSLSYTPNNEDSFNTQYRTHLFFNARGGANAYDDSGLLNFFFIKFILIFSWPINDKLRCYYLHAKKLEF